MRWPTVMPCADAVAASMTTSVACVGGEPERIRYGDRVELRIQFVANSGGPPPDEYGLPDLSSSAAPARKTTPSAAVTPSTCCTGASSELGTGRCASPKPPFCPPGSIWPRTTAATPVGVVL